MLFVDNKRKLGNSHKQKNNMAFVAKRSTQKGTVLIITVLIVAVITGLAIDFASRFQLSLSRAENRLALTQINQLVFAMEHAAIFGLKEDKKSDNDDGNEAFDHLKEDWKTREFEFQGFLQILLGDEAEISNFAVSEAGTGCDASCCISHAKATAKGALGDSTSMRF